jgi:hypothetical protein
MRVTRARGPVRAFVAAAALIAVASGTACDLSPQPLPPRLTSNSGGGSAPTSGGGGAVGSSSGSGSGGLGNIGSSGTTASSGGYFTAGSGTAATSVSGTASGGEASTPPVLPEDAAAAPDALLTASEGDADEGNADASRDGKADGSDANSESDADRDAEPPDAKCDWSALAADATWACE